MKRNYFLFHSYFTKTFVFWFLLLTAGNATAQSTIVENVSIDDSVAYQTQRIASKEIPTFYVTKGTFIVNNEDTNADIVTIPNKVIVRNVKVKSEQKQIGEDKLILKEKVVKYRKPVIENNIVFNADHQSSDSFSNNIIFSKNIILPQYNSGKVKVALVKNTSYYTLRILNPYVEPLLEIIFSDNLLSANFFTRPPPTVSFL